jgi:pectin methylesterase-like acyl-CoA thioesterase
LGPDADGAASGGTTDPVSDGRATGDEVVAAAGADGSSGAAGGGSSTTPVDCRGISNAGWDLCSATDDSCAAVFNDGAGCIAVCAAVGLECIEALENLEDSCGADTSLPATACASGHQSDYCVCGGDAPSGSGGVGNAGAGSGGADTGGVGNAGAGSGGTAAGAGGEAGAGGSGGAPPTGSDCNTATGTLFEVASDGSAQFNTVQAAVDSASGNEPTIIRISPGTYYEKLDIQSSQITLCGQMGQEANTLLTYDDSASDVGTSGSYSVRIGGDDVSVENLTLENSTGSGVQAVALLAQGNRLQFRNCRFIGYQDTVYTHSGSQYFRHCFIQGSVDYIFGGATAVFEECTMYNIEGGTAITAPSTEEGVPFGLVFLGGEVTAHDSVSNSSMALGRNWRPYGSTTYIGTELGDHISAVGWVPMGDNTLDTARFSEYQTTGPGANPEARASRSSQLSDAQAATYTVANIFGSWTPSFSE